MRDPLLVNANARRLLERLYTQAMEEHETIEGVIFTVDQSDADTLEITLRDVEAARERLVRAGLCERMTYENFKLSNEGLDALERAELLEDLLPVAAAVLPPSTVVAADELNRDARDLLTVLRDRAVSAPRGVVVIHAEYAEAELGFDADRFARAAARATRLTSLVASVFAIVPCAAAWWTPTVALAPDWVFGRGLGNRTSGGGQRRTALSSSGARRTRSTSPRRATLTAGHALLVRLRRHHLNGKPMLFRSST